MQDHFSFEYELTDAFAARTADAYVRARVRNVDRKFSIVFATLVLWVPLCGLTVLLGIVMDLPWWVCLIPGSILAMFGTMLLLPLSLHLFVLIVRPLARWGTRRKMMAGYAADRTIRWTFGDDQFTVRSAISDRHVPWQGHRQLHVYRELWTLGLKNGSDLILPVELLTPEAQGLIRCKTGEAGAPVITEESAAA